MANLMQYRPLSDLQTEMERLVSDVLPNWREGAANALWNPSVDVSESENEYKISMDLPGLAREDVQITFDRGLLQISGERKMREYEQQPKFHRIERWYGRFFRQFRFEQPVNPEGISAGFENGVLTVVAPKKEEAKPRRIEVS